MKRNKIDAAFSNYIRMRAGWKCEKCGTSPSNRQALHCSHVRSRKFSGTRWYEGNAFSVCASCHRKFHDDPIMHIEWVKKHIGQVAYHNLKMKSRMITKLTKADKEAIYQDLKQRIKDLAE